MNQAKILWYSISKDLDVEEHEPVDVAKAIEIVDGYFGRAGNTVQGGEEAIAATLFGFSRSEREFIEICVHSFSHVSYNFQAPNKDVPWLLKPWKGIFRYKEELRSRDLLIRRINEFFTCSAEELIRRYGG
jgi:hypothetical protein